jgi:hypothetical protein
MGRTVASAFVGLTAWFAAATAINWLMRAAWPGYAAAEVPMTFTLGMLLGRLATGAVASLCAGAAAAWVSRGNVKATNALAAVLLLLFIPVHYGLWEKFPVWYHFVFLVSLVPLTLLGARLRAPHNPDVRSP